MKERCKEVYGENLRCRLAYGHAGIHKWWVGRKAGSTVKWGLEPSMEPKGEPGKKSLWAEMWKLVWGS